MQKAKSTFAVLFGHRGIFPAAHQSTARREIAGLLKKQGYGAVMLPENATPNGAVETPAHGAAFAKMLRDNYGKVDGVIVILPNFGDETGVMEALREIHGMPVLIQAYPDEMDKMSPALRRDAFCGKMSVMDVLCQCGIQFTAFPPHVVSPSSPAFLKQLEDFDAICQITKHVRNMRVGSVGARTTAFKTVRIDELALQKAGITMETFDLSSVLRDVAALDIKGADYLAREQQLLAVSTWSGVPKKAFGQLCRMAVVLDRLIAEHGLDAMALRCWIEMQEILGISPCVLVSVLNESGLPVACEVDVGNAVMMRVLQDASRQPVTCLDWNNNYGDEEDKCILFHCGPVPPSMMSGPGKVTEHAILKNAVGSGCSFGCNTGRLRPMEMTYGSLLTKDGRCCCYVGEGQITEDPIPKEFFGCAGVAKIKGLQTVLQTIGYQGHRHHVSVCPGHSALPVREALSKYCGFEVTAV